MVPSTAWPSADAEVGDAEVGDDLRADADRAPNVTSRPRRTNHEEGHTPATGSRPHPSRKSQRPVEGEADDGDPANGADRSELPADELDDELDRDELQDRYYGLLQELRVLLPGVQILVAFLVTVPFASGFDKLNEADRDLYSIALIAGILAVVAFTTPTVFHRVGNRRARSVRLQWGIRCVRAGLLLLGVSLVVTLWVVTNVVLAVPMAIAAVAIVAVAIIGLWVALPVVATRWED